jgi:hypothetical protein
VTHARKHTNEIDSFLSPKWFYSWTPSKGADVPLLFLKKELNPVPNLVRKVKPCPHNTNVNAAGGLELRLVTQRVHSFFFLPFFVLS